MAKATCNRLVIALFVAEMRGHMCKTLRRNLHPHALSEHSFALLISVLIPVMINPAIHVHS